MELGEIICIILFFGGAITSLITIDDDFNEGCFISLISGLISVAALIVFLAVDWDDENENTEELQEEKIEISDTIKEITNDTVRIIITDTNKITVYDTIRVSNIENYDTIVLKENLERD